MCIFQNSSRLVTTRWQLQHRDHRHKHCHWPNRWRRTCLVRVYFPEDDHNCLSNSDRKQTNGMRSPEFADTSCPRRRQQPLRCVTWRPVVGVLASITAGPAAQAGAQLHTLVAPAGVHRCGRTDDCSALQSTLPAKSCAEAHTALITMLRQALGSTRLAGRTLTARSIA